MHVRTALGILCEGKWDQHKFSALIKSGFGSSPICIGQINFLHLEVLICHSAVKRNFYQGDDIDGRNGDFPSMQLIFFCDSPSILYI